MAHESHDMLTSAPTLRPGTTVAVTGATGFIGGRLVERLSAQGAIVTCLQRRATAESPSNRINVSVRTLDLAEPEPVRRALDGIEVVFHCAFDHGNTVWNHSALHALVAGCLANGCRRLVHVSSFVVYKLPSDGEVTEDSAENQSEAGYAHTKLRLESELMRAVREDGLPGTIIQPTIVYGPFSRPWTIDPADMLRYGTVILPNSGEGICNAVYVDDVVSALILSAEHSGAVGQRFLVSGPEPITWRHFYEEMARAAGAKEPQYLPADEIVRRGGKIRRIQQLVSNPELIIRRVAQAGPCRKLVQAGLGALPHSAQESVLIRLFGPITRRRGHLHLPNLGQLRFLQSRSTIGSGKIRQELGYSPQFGFSEGMVPTSHYLKEVHV